MDLSLIKHDGEIEISIGKNRKELNWKNKTMLWSEFVEKVSVTTRTAETYNEYLASKKERQDEIKDVGGFVGGSLAGGRRKHDSVLNRQLICLDIDHSTNMEVWDNYKLLYGNSALIHTTHKHSSNKPRYRLIIVLKNPIPKDQYQAVARKIAGDLGINQFDDTTFEPSRLMYFPSTSKDGEFIFDYCDGEWLDPKEILGLYVNWRDASSWPQSDRVNTIIHREMKKQGDPLQKPGLIGAFCRSYTIEEAIDTFLVDEYQVCEGNRYTYKHGSTSAGLVTYENKYAFSHHGTDPTSGKLCNAFDLVRIHKFGLMDEDAKEGTASNRLPSYTAMVEFCSNDARTKSLLVQEKLDGVKEDFADYANAEESEEVDDSWKSKLDVDNKGRIKSTSKNILIIMENDPLIKNKIALNEFEHREVMLSRLPWRKKDDPNVHLNDVDDSNLRIYFENKYNIVSTKKIDDALKRITYMNSFHPIKDYIKNLPDWDKVPRIDTHYIDYLGVKDSEYSRAVSRISFVACLARIFKPGCKFDYVLTLVGKQGLGKSKLIKKIAKGWFSDSLSSITGKDAYEQLQGAWIVELGELASLKKADLEQIKHFITKSEDRYRVAYGRRVEDFPRQCVFFGTTNHKNFLKDPTGDRRFWPLTTMEQEPTKDMDKDLTDYEIDQIWAEAYHYYLKGEAIYLPKELEEQANMQQEAHTVENEKKGLIEEYLNLELPECWDRLDIIERQNYVHNKDFRDNILEGNPNTHKRTKVCVAEIWCELMRGALKDMNRHNTKELHDVMRKMDGWEEEKRMRFKLYGRQKTYVRV